MAFEFNGATLLHVQHTYLAPFRDGSAPKAAMGGWFYFPEIPSALTHLVGCYYTNSASANALGQVALAANASAALGFNIRGVFGASNAGTFLASGLSVIAPGWYFLAAAGDVNGGGEGDYVVYAGPWTSDGLGTLTSTTHADVATVEGTWPTTALSDLCIGGVKVVGSSAFETVEAVAGVKMFDLWGRGDSTHEDAQPSSAQIAEMYNGGSPVMGAPKLMPMPGITASGTDYRSLWYYPLRNHLRDEGNPTGNISGRLTLSTNTAGLEQFADHTDRYNLSAAAKKYIFLTDIQIGIDNDPGSDAAARNLNTYNRAVTLVNTVNGLVKDALFTLGDDIDTPDPAGGEHAAEVQLYDLVWSLIEGTKYRILGNHDANETAHMLGDHAQKYDDNFVVDVGTVCRFICINSNPLKSQSDPTLNNYTADDVDAILAFIWDKSTDAAGDPLTTFDHLFLVMHQPPFIDDEVTDADDEVWQLGNDENNTNPKSEAWHQGTTNVAVRETIMHVCRTNAIRRIFAGHRHTPETISSRNGTADTVSIHIAGATSWANNATWWGSGELPYMAVIVDDDRVHLQHCRYTDLPAGFEYRGTLDDADLTAISAAVWARLTSALNTAGSVGERLVSNLDAAVSSRSDFDPATDTVDVGKISGDSAAADNLEAIHDGTGGFMVLKSSVDQPGLEIFSQTGSEPAVSIMHSEELSSAITVTAQQPGSNAITLVDANGRGVAGLKVNVDQISDDSVAANNIEAVFDGTGAAVTLEAGGNLKTTLTTINTGVVNNGSSLTTVIAQTDTLEGTVGTINTGVGALQTSLNSIAGAGFDAGTDTLEAITNAIGTVGANVDAVLTDTGTTIPAQIGGLNNLSAAEVRAEIDANSTQLAAIKAKTDDITPGGGGGSGDTVVNHDTGGDDNLRATASGAGLDNVTIRAYLTSEFDADATSATLRATSITAADGRWVTPMMLNSGLTYTLVYSRSDLQTATKEVTVP